MHVYIQEHGNQVTQQFQLESVHHFNHFLMLSIPDI